MSKIKDTILLVIGFTTGFIGTIALIFLLFYSMSIFTDMQITPRGLGWITLPFIIGIYSANFIKDIIIKVLSRRSEDANEKNL